MRGDCDEVVHDVHDDDDYLAFFTDWLQRLQTSLESSLSDLLPPDDTDNDSSSLRQALVATCTCVQSAAAVQQAAVKVRDELQQQIPPPSPIDPNILADAQHAVDVANDAFNQALETCQVVADATLLNESSTSTASSSPLSHLLSSDYDDADLVTYTVLKHATAAGLAQYCNTHSAHQARQVIDTLQNDADFLRRCLESGGARNGQYGPAVETYMQLVKDKRCVKDEDMDHKPQTVATADNTDTTNEACAAAAAEAVLERLALAVALELADPYPLFNHDETGLYTDAMQRYIYYQQAYLLGDLDPAFEMLTVWELRHVVNSDASEEELSWGRESLLAYRPDICLIGTSQNDNDTNDQWRYCYIVRTDVDYKDPDFYKSPRSYDQILSGGGKCGPRAWYGRFVCKAFGIPTWGVRQPGHAAMAKWTQNGDSWIMCLGAGFDVSWWDDQCGVDFLLEAQARKSCQAMSSFRYLQKVLRLEWIASFYNEKIETVRRYAMVDANSPWYTLGMLQRRRLVRMTASTQRGTDAASANSATFSGHGATTLQQHKGGVRNKIASFRVQQQNNQLSQPGVSSSGAACRPLISNEATRIVIPASSCVNPTSSTQKVTFMPSFMGGQQLFLKEDAEIEYMIVTPQCSSRVRGVLQYKITCRLATAHRQEQPISLTVNDSTVHEIILPYTMALWGDTEPVVIALDGSSPQVSLKFSRPMQQFGFSLRDITLTLCD